MSKRQTSQTTAELVPQGGSTGTSSGNNRRSPRSDWRIEAPFLAQMIGERAKNDRHADNKLAQARRNVPSILGAYGSAASLQLRTPATLDLIA